MIRPAATVALSAGTSGAYTLHRIEFPNYVQTTDADPSRTVVRIRSALTIPNERDSLCGGQSFPAQSGALFTVMACDASSGPVHFTSPVVLTVQFKNRLDPLQTDVVHLDGALGVPANMRLACDTLAGESVSFALTDSPGQTVNTSSGTVTVSNYVGLTGSDGRGTFGAVAGRFFTPADRWALYR